MPIVIAAALVVLIVLIVLFYVVIPKNMSPVFWGKIELFWVMVSFLGAMYGIVEVLNVDKRTEYEELHDAAKAQFEEAQILVGEHIPTVDFRHSSEGQREGLEWFHTVVNLMDDGYDSKKWEGFVNYTEGYVFKRRGFPVNQHLQAIKYHWPEDPAFNSEEVDYKHNIKVIADKLEAIEQEKQRLIRNAPSSKPVTWPRYVIALVFLIGLSLKINKIRHESYR